MLITHMEELTLLGLSHWILKLPFQEKKEHLMEMCITFLFLEKKELHWGMGLASDHAFIMQVIIFPFLNFLMTRPSLFPSNWFHLCSLSAKDIHLGLRIMMP